MATTAPAPSSSVTVFICGMLSLVLGPIPLVGLALGFVSLVKTRTAPADGLRTAGQVLAIIGLSLGSIWHALLLIQTCISVYQSLARVL